MEKLICLVGVALLPVIAIAKDKKSEASVPDATLLGGSGQR
jgi:hypothetical protein